ncbi:MAG: hypothetical protein R3256_11270 [Thalassovita sp.]|nr:hypothetical protein [Thalassovita sp.]
MKVVLYIGHHKTGSSALQGYMARNWHALAEAGILYPAVEAEGLSRNLASCLTGKETTKKLPLVVREPHNALAFAMISAGTGTPMPHFQRGLPPAREMLRSLRHQIDLLQPKAVILCSEVMSNFAKQAPGKIEELATLFSGAEVEIYCTLRRPDLYLASWYGQRLKFGQKIAPLRDGGALAYRDTIHFDFAAMIYPWQTAFPRARFHLRNYADVLAAGGAVEDFTAQVGVDFPAGLVMPPRANPGLPYAAMEIMRRGNQVLNRADRLALRSFLLHRTNVARLPRNDEVELFGAETRRELYQSFLPVHDALNRMTGRDAFFPDLQDMLIAHPIPETELPLPTLRKVRRNIRALLLPRAVRGFLRDLRKDLSRR